MKKYCIVCKMKPCIIAVMRKVGLKKYITRFDVWVSNKWL